jgi:hypothetical protein
MILNHNAVVFVFVSKTDVTAVQNGAHFAAINEHPRISHSIPERVIRDIGARLKNDRSTPSNGRPGSK